MASRNQVRSSISSRTRDEIHGVTMTDSMIDKLKAARTDNQEATFSLFTLAGHVVSGKITAIGNTVTLAAGKEVAEVPIDRIEAFSFRKQ
jgi:riboflavin synthase alpha subunit